MEVNQDKSNNDSQGMVGLAARSLVCVPLLLRFCNRVAVGYRGCWKGVYDYVYVNGLLDWMTCFLLKMYQKMLDCNRLTTKVSQKYSGRNFRNFHKNNVERRTIRFRYRLKKLNV